MVRRTIAGAVLSLVLAVSVGRIAAQVPATLVLRSGERLSGQLVDLGRAGFTIQVGGQDRQVATNDVVAVEFTGGSPSNDVRTRLRAGQPVVVLRSGEIVEGRLNDVGGTSPLRLSVDTASGPRDFTSNDVAQIYLAALPSEQSPAASGGAIRVAADQEWVHTGVIVRRGERVTFRASGDIMAGPGASAGPAGSPILKSPNYPVPTAQGGALIAKVGDPGRPFLVGSNTNPIPMPTDGELLLGINDDGFGDNSGAFSVLVTTTQSGGGVRRR